MASKFLPVVLKEALADNRLLLPRLPTGDATDLRPVLSYCANLRVAAIASLLLTGRPRRFLFHLHQSGRAFAHFLAKTRTPPRLSQSLPLYDALGAGDFEAASEISRRARRTWARGEEYEEDFLFTELLMRRFFLDASLDDCEALLARYERALQGTEDVRLDVCKALVHSDADAFNESLGLYLEERRSSFEEAFEKTPPSEEERATWQVCIEGLALVRLAERVGLETEEEYLHIPSNTRKQPRGLVFRPDSWTELDGP